MQSYRRSQIYMIYIIHMQTIYIEDHVSSFTIPRPLCDELPSPVDQNHRWAKQQLRQLRKFNGKCQHYRFLQGSYPAFERK